MSARQRLLARLFFEGWLGHGHLLEGVSGDISAARTHTGWGGKRRLKILANVMHVQSKFSGWKLGVAGRHGEVR